VSNELNAGCSGDPLADRPRFTPVGLARSVGVDLHLVRHLHRQRHSVERSILQLQWRR